MSEKLIKMRPPLHREVAESISERIISGELAEKSLLPAERELCETMGVSRTVIREAMKLLESRGLVRIDRGRGTVVQEAHMGPLGDSLKLLLRRRHHLIEDLLEVRKVLEVAMVALAASRRNEANLRSMERSLEIMRRKPNEPAGYVDADVEFHAEIARAAQNPVLLVLLEPLAELLRESRTETFSGPKMVKERLKQHEAIFDAIKRSDPQGAMSAMSSHLSDTAKDLEKQKRS